PGRRSVIGSKATAREGFAGQADAGQQAHGTTAAPFRGLVTREEASDEQADQVRLRDGRSGLFDRKRARIGLDRRVDGSARTARKKNFSLGGVYEAVISKERRGEYLGASVQVIPHVTDEIKARVRAGAEDADLAIVEVGGTVGDIESLPFLEALRQLKLEL